MPQNIAIKNSDIKQIFEKMSYGTDKESTDSARKWLKQRTFCAYIESKSEIPTGTPEVIKSTIDGTELGTIYHAPSDTVEKIIKKLITCKNRWDEVIETERAHLLQEFASQIEKKLQLFCQIETLARGILMKDTKNTLSLIIEGLRYYAAGALEQQLKSKLSVCIMSDETPLGLLGYCLGANLAAGNRVIIQAKSRIVLSVSLLIEIAENVGFPDNVIRIIPGDEVQCFFNNPSVTFLTIFDSLYKEKYSKISGIHPKINAVLNGKIPMIIFSDADLDSACNSVIQSAWGYQGMTSWSVNRILIQEDVYEAVINKLKHKLKQTKIGFGNDQNVDISFPISKKALEQYTKIVEDAQKQGIEIFQASNNEIFTPTLLIGGNPYGNNVIAEDNSAPVVTVTAFRTANEAVTLANNSRQGFAVTLWTENSSLVNEVSKKLKVGHIWVNSHGLFAVDIPFRSCKESGWGYFGGREGLYEYFNFTQFRNYYKFPLQNLNIVLRPNLNQAISSVKQIQEGWNKLTMMAKREKLIKLAKQIDESDDWLSVIYKSSFQFTLKSSSFIQGNFNINVYKEACGIMALKLPEKRDSYVKLLVIGALLAGNGIIFLDSSKEQFFFKFSKLAAALNIPTSAIEYGDDTHKAAQQNQLLNTYISAHSFSNDFSDEWQSILNQVTNTKIVWNSNSYSFA